MPLEGWHELGHELQSRLLLLLLALGDQVPVLVAIRAMPPILPGTTPSCAHYIPTCHSVAVRETMGVFAGGHVTTSDYPVLTRPSLVSKPQTHTSSIALWRETIQLARVGPGSGRRPSLPSASLALMRRRCTKTTHV